MKFSTFVKLGGHAFNLLQNKDLMELYGMAKPGLQKQLQGIKPPTASTSPPPLQQWPAGSYPTHFPIPIDSPYMQGPIPPYGLMGLQARPGWFYGPPAFPPNPRNPYSRTSRNKTDKK